MASRQFSEITHPPREALTFTAVSAALSDPVRLAIVATLGALPAGSELPCTTFALPVSKSTQSAHFRALREAGVIRQRDAGTRRLNSLRREDLEARFPGLLDLAIAQGEAVSPAREPASGKTSQLRPVDAATAAVQGQFPADV